MNATNLARNAFIIEQHVNYPMYSIEQLVMFTGMPESFVKSAIGKYSAPVTGFDKFKVRESKLNWKTDYLKAG